MVPPLGAFPFKPNVIRRNLAEMIVVHGFPLSMVENHGFRKFSHSLNPLFKVVSQEEMKDDILGIYHDEKYKTMKLMESNKSRIAVTIGKWASDHQKKGFIAIIAHYVDNSWVLQSQVLRFACVPCSETPEDLSKTLVDCLKDWNIDRKLSTLMINDGFANDSVIDLVLEKLSTDLCWLKGTSLHMQCFACILNAMAQDGLEVIGDGVERVRDSVAFWMATSEREKKFKETAIQLKVQLTKRLILDCKSRWSSTYLMLHNALGYRDVFSCLKELEPLYDQVPLEEDWETVKEVCERLKLFYKITKLFSKKPMVNHYFPMICEIKIALREWLDCGCQAIQSMASKMKAKFDKYWAEVNAILAVATIFDPRYKLKFLEFCFPEIYGDTAQEEIEKVRQLSYDLVNGYQSMSNQIGHSFSTSSQSHSGRINSAMHKFYLFLASKQKISSVKSEFDRYLEERLVPISMDFDVLCWWKDYRVAYPRLEMVARDILAIPISTIASESASTMSGKFVISYLSKLHPSTLEAFMCTQGWLLSQMKDSHSSACSWCCTFLQESDIDEGDETE